ncbi:hypothetical protein KIN20_026778 [Parelaphostrongylus tenuis]|uniref:Uncharacterized protein n=1 Tax=Parelaphostrongylus tenuis TaxID=148309 RepID=A0AAD5QYH5_PARTN|nr:hypothetical protein KIN20_026778 [Parelaphostrongylus tenuis]
MRQFSHNSRATLILLTVIPTRFNSILSSRAGNGNGHVSFWGTYRSSNSLKSKRKSIPYNVHHSMSWWEGREGDRRSAR